MALLAAAPAIGKTINATASAAAVLVTATHIIRFFRR